MEVNKKTVRDALGWIGLTIIDLVVIGVVWRVIPLGLSHGKSETLMDLPHPTFMVIAGVILTLVFVWPVVSPVAVKPISRVFYPKNRDAAETFAARHSSPRAVPSFITIVITLAIMAYLAFAP